MSGLRYEQYDAAKEAESVAAMRELIAGDLSEPYSIYVYRYFLYSWGDLCYLVRPFSCSPPPYLSPSLPRTSSTRVRIH